MSLIPLPPDVSVLNCTAGDLTFSFDPADPLECARAERVVQDMLARGYLLFARVDEQLVRVTQFDPATSTYILADGPTVAPASAETPAAPKPKRGRPRKVAAQGTPVTAIAPTSGG